MGSSPLRSAEAQVVENIEPTEEAVDDRPEHALALGPGDRDGERVAEGDAVAHAGSVVDRSHDGCLLGKSRELVAYAITARAAEMCYRRPSPTLSPRFHAHYRQYVSAQSGGTRSTASATGRDPTGGDRDRGRVVRAAATALRGRPGCDRAR